ncbi:MAG: transporter associated domain-containing protein [Alkalibacterium sp.]|nr:transporter associated domain-containing protein [Alkalibacterium sp.]
MIEELGQFPQVGDSFRYYNMKVSVTAVRNRRVLEVQIDYLPDDKDENEDL